MPPPPSPPDAGRHLLRAELRATLRLAVPVTLVQVGFALMGVVDTVMVGHVSASALAAVALGNLYFFGVTAFGQGLLMALDPVVAQAVGAEDQPALARGVQRGLVLGGAISLPLVAALLPAAPVLRALEQPEEIVPLAAAFVRASAPGVIPFLAFVVLRQSLQAMGRTRAIVLTIVSANVANALFNWLLVFGHAGAPALGPIGSAWASTASRWLMAVLLLAGGWRRLRPALVPWRADTLRAAPLAAMVRLGAPVGAQQLLEYGAFGAIGLLMGRLGTTGMAGHQTALNLASLTFMVPLGVSAAAAVRVGHAIGRGDGAGARRAALAAYAWGIGFMALSACVLSTAPHALAALYTPDRDVRAVAAALIPIAGVFQVFDGMQVVSLGVLRGAGDTRAPMLINLVGFWLLGIPAGVWLAFRAGGGPRGLWWGLVVGLAAVGVVLALRARHRLAAPPARVAVD